MAIYYADPENGNDAADGLSFANRRKLISGLTLAAGDTVRYIGSPDPIDTGKTFTGVFQNATLTLSAAVTQLIDDCEGAFTASTNITAATSTTRKSGSNSCSLTVASGFTTGKMAYKALAGTLDLSGYEQITFWLRTSAAMATGSSLRVDLCSDTTGDVPVDQFTITRAFNTTNIWFPVTLNKGSALGSSIASISIHALVDPGTPVILFDNFTACKAASAADCLTLHTIISHAASGSFQAIQSFNGTSVVLDASVSTTNSNSANRGFYLPTAAGYTLYKVNPVINTTYTAVNVVTPGQNGTSAQDVTLSFGWDRTNMSTQNLTTWVHVNGGAAGISLGTRDFYTITGPSGWVGANTNGLNWAGQGITLAGELHCNNSASDPFASTSTISNTDRSNIITGNLFAISNAATASNSSTHPTYITGAVTVHSTASGSGITVAGAMTTFTGTVYSTNNSSNGVILTGYLIKFTGPVVCANNANHGFSVSATTGSGYITVNNLTCTSNTQAGIYAGPGRNKVYKFTGSGNGLCSFVNDRGFLYVRNITSSDSTLVDPMTSTTELGQIFLYNVNGDGFLRQYGNGFSMIHDSSQTSTGTGKSIKLSPTQLERSTAEFPAFTIAKVFPVKANTQFTITGKVRRDNSGISARLRIPGGQLNGLPSDIIANSTATGINSWSETLTLQGTPTESGALELWFEAWGGTTFNAWLDEVTGP